MTLVSATLAAPDWLPIRDEHWLWLAGVGAFGAAGQHYLTEAFRLAPTSTVAPIE